MSIVKSQELGVFESDVVCFSMDNLILLANRLNISIDDLIDQHEGVVCDLGAGQYSIETLKAIDQDGETYPVITIGCDVERFVRFLREDEPEFEEFYKNHPLQSKVGKGANFNKILFENIALEYKAKLNDTRRN